jgi:hypothetical protein
MLASAPILVLTACSSAPSRKLIVVQSLGYGEIGHVLEIGEKKARLDIFQDVPGAELGSFAKPMRAYGEAVKSMQAVRQRQAVPDIPGYVVYRDSMRGDPDLILQMPAQTQEERIFLGLLESLRIQCFRHPQSTLRLLLEIKKGKGDSAHLFARFENRGQEAFILDSGATLKAEEMRENFSEPGVWKTRHSQILPDSLLTLAPKSSVSLALGPVSAKEKTYCRVSLRGMSRSVFSEGVVLAGQSAVDSLP